MAYTLRARTMPMRYAPRPSDSPKYFALSRRGGFESAAGGFAKRGPHVSVVTRRDAARSMGFEARNPRALGRRAKQNTSVRINMVHETVC